MHPMGHGSNNEDKISVAQLLEEQKVVNLKEGELANLMRECTEKSESNLRKITELEMKYAAYEREVELREYKDFHCRISDLERENENLRINQAPRLQETVAAHKHHIQLLQNELAAYKSWLKSSEEVKNNVVKHAMSQKEDLIKYKNKIDYLKNQIATLKGERPSLFTRAVARVKNAFPKFEFVSNFFCGLKFSFMLLLSLSWLTVQTVFALPTILVKSLSAKILFGFLCLIFAHATFIGMALNLTPSTWLPNFLQYCGLHYLPHLNFSQKFWLASHVMQITHWIYGILLTTNLFSLVSEYGKYKSKNNKNKKISETKPDPIPQESKFPIINCDVTPTIPDGFTIAKPEFQLPNVIKGKIEWNHNNVNLHIAEGQKNNWMGGYKLKEELKYKEVYSAAVLDYLLKNPQQIPESWKSKYVYFWGTVYSSASGHLCVRCLYFDGSRWISCHYWLDDGWRVSYPAAVCASVT